MKKLIIVGVAIVFLVCITLIFLHMVGRPVKVHTNKAVEGLPSEVTDVLFYASLAPNSHNAQMWKVSVDTKKEQVRIYLDKERTLNEVDSKNREAYISIGAFTANLLKAFEAYGYETDCVIPDKEDCQELVVITYSKLDSATINKGILETISKRHTDKSQYLDKKISEQSLTELLNGSTDLFYYPKASFEFDYLKDSTVAAMKLQANNESKAAEFSRWLRLSDKETLKTKDGLSAEQLGITGMKKTIYYLITTHESAQGDSFAKQSVDTTSNQVNNCSGFLLLTGGTSRKELIETGIRLENVWLNAVNLGISVHPMSQILEEQPYSDEINAKLGISAPIHMVLRLGYVSDYGMNNNIRRDLGDYITVDE
jgi:hypothetical protein